MAEELPSWLIAQVASHILNLKGWCRMYGSNVFTDEQRQELEGLACAINPGDPRIINPVIWRVPNSPNEKVEEVPGCKT
jgi:hypothetical protein